MKKNLFAFVLLVTLFSVAKSFGQTNTRFNDGYLTVYKATSASALANTGTAIVAEEYNTTTTTQAAPNYSVAIPTATGNKLVVSGTATSSGGMTRSENGRYLLMPGYNGLIGDANSTFTTNGAVRTINGTGTVGAGIAANGLLWLSASNNLRGATSDDGTNYWISGNGVGIQTSTTGNPITTITTTSTNNRDVVIYNGQLYFTTGAGSQGIYSVSTGKPITIGQVSTRLFTPLNTDTYAFSISPDATTLYYVASTGGGIYRCTYNGTTWTTGTQIVSGAGYTGIAVDWSNYAFSAAAANGARIFASNPSTIIAANDNGTAVTTTTILRTEPAPTMNAFRQIAFSPIKQTITLGANTPNASNLSPSTNNNVLFQFNLNANEGNATLKKLILNQSGTATIGTGNDISNFKLIDDANNNGIADPAELASPLATGTVASSNITFSSIVLSSYITEGTSKNFIMVGDVSASAPNGATFVPSIVSNKTLNGNNYTTNAVNAGNSWVTIGATPPTGNTLTIASCTALSITSQAVSPTAVCEGSGTAKIYTHLIGTAPFTYQWKENNVPISNNATYSGATSDTLKITNPSLSLNGNTYKCVVSNCAGTDSTNNLATLTVIAAPSQPTASATGQPTCSVATGAITVTAPTGVGITYSIDGTTYTNTTGIFNDVAAGNYYVTVKNSDNCPSPQSPQITINAQPQTPAAPTVSVTEPTCSSANGNVAVTSTTTGLTFSNDGVNYAGYASPFVYAANATYSITAQNTNGCISSAAIGTLAAQPQTPSAPSVSVTQPTCASSNGTVAITSSTTGLTFSTDSTNYAAYTSPFVVAANAAYSIKARNASGCISTAVAGTMGAQPQTPAVPSVSLTQPTCSSATGTIAITSSTIGLTFTTDSANFAAYVAPFTFAANAAYSIMARNADGCVSTATTGTMNAQPQTPASPSVSLTQPTCSSATGSVAITSTTTGLTFSTDGINYEVYASPFVVSSGAAYSITARNADGCTSLATVGTMGVQPSTPNTPSVNVTPPTCSSATGTVAITSSTTGLTFSTDGTNYAAYSSPYVVAANAAYSITARNGNGCVSTAVTGTMGAQPQTPAAPTVSVTQPTFVSATGFVTITSSTTDLTFSTNGINYAAYVAPYEFAASAAYSITARNLAGCVSVATTGTLNAQPQNQTPPSVSITSPANASVFDVSDTIHIVVDAVANGGNIVHVDFLMGDVSIGTDSIAPYTKNIITTPGVHTLKAIAYDNHLLSDTSVAVNIVANNIKHPVVTINAPINIYLLYLDGDSITVSTSTFGAAGIAFLEFFIDNVSFGTDNTFPYAKKFLGDFGSHAITAKVHDLLGGVYTSPAANLFVKFKPSDFNNDAVIDINDYSMFVGSFGQSCNCMQDLNRDGVVNINDFSIFVGTFGQHH